MSASSATVVDIERKPIVWYELRTLHFSDRDALRIYGNFIFIFIATLRYRRTSQSLTRSRELSSLNFHCHCCWSAHRSFCSTLPDKSTGCPSNECHNPDSVCSCNSLVCRSLRGDLWLRHDPSPPVRGAASCVGARSSLGIQCRHPRRRNPQSPACHHCSGAQWLQPRRRPFAPPASPH